MKQSIFIFFFLLLYFSLGTTSTNATIMNTYSYSIDCDEYAVASANAHMVYYYGWFWKAGVWAHPNSLDREYSDTKKFYYDYCMEYTALGYQVLPPFFSDQ